MKIKCIELPTILGEMETPSLPERIEWLTVEYAYGLIRLWYLSPLDGYTNGRQRIGVYTEFTTNIPGDAKFLGMIKVPETNFVFVLPPRIEDH